MFSKTKVTSLIIASFISFTSYAKGDDMMVRMRTINIMPDEKGTTDVAGGSVHLQSESVPEVDFTYFITDSIGLELIAATANHSASVYNSSLGNLNLGEVSLLPPTLLVQYHHEFGNFKPYVGVGLNYTFFYGEDPGQFKGVSYDNSFGWEAQIGADYKVAERVYLNFDLKRIAISTDVTVDYSGTIVKSDLDINPIVAGLGIGYRF